MTAMSVDTDTTGNTNAAVGAIDACVGNVTAGTSVTFDVTAQGVPPFSNGGDADPANDSGGMTGVLIQPGVRCHGNECLG